MSATADDGYGVYAYGNGSVTVTGNVESKLVAVVSGDNSEVTVTGDVTTNAEGESWAAEAINGSTLTINGDVTATGTGSWALVCAENGNTATVTGDVSSDYVAVDVIGTNNTVVVEGTAAGEYAVVFDETAVANAESNVVILGALEGKLGVENADGVYAAEGGEEEKIAASIAYIIDSQLSGAKLSGTEELEGYTVAREGDKLVLSGTIDGLNVSGKATATRNADGTYTITMERGGGVYVYVFTSKYVTLIPVYSEEGIAADDEKGLEITAKVQHGIDYALRNVGSTKVKVDGAEAINEETGEKLYTARVYDNKLYVMLKPEYIETLSEGEYVVELVVGTSSCKLVLVKTAEGEYMVREYVEEEA